MTDATRNLLEQHFDTAFAAPDGVAKLRELILTLAMQGKLVEQDPNDPPASELSKEIEAEKQRLVKAGKIKKPKPLPPIKPEEMPYQLPPGWEWVRLIEIGSWALGSGLPHSIQGDTGQEILLCKVSDMNLPGNEKFIVTANNTLSEKVVQQNKLNISDPGTIIFPKIGGAIATNKRRILQKKTVIDNNCLGITPASAMDLEWCYQLLLNFDFAKYQTGTSVPAISQGIIGEIVIGLPPASEQHRIVARIGQLMARCDALEALRTEREEKRLAVHAAAIKQLLDVPSSPAQHVSSPPRRRGASHSDSLDSRLRGNDGFDFIQQHFGKLYTVKVNVAELCKAILQLAVMGRLVEQDPNDPPASELLKEIEAEKQRLVKTGKFKKPKPLPPMKPEEVPYELPQGWEWVRLGTVAEVNGGFAFKSSKYTNDGVRVIRISDFDEKGFKNDKVVRYSYTDDLSSFNLESSNILMAMTGGTVGKSLLVKSLPEPMVVNQRVATIKMVKGVVPEFINGLIRTNLIQSVIQAAKNSTNDNISMGDITGFFVPLPPFPEQHRIVARIDQLMALCDSLDQQIDAVTEKQTALLNAVMAQV